jgi:hypothetical protein
MYEEEFSVFFRTCSSDVRGHRVSLAFGGPTDAMDRREKNDAMPVESPGDTFFSESHHLKVTQYGNNQPPDIIPSHDSYSTTSSTYGAHWQSRFGPASEPIVARRPAGADIGTSRPWPNMNAPNLASRMPPSWMLCERPATSPMDVHVNAPSAGQMIMTLSQRDYGRTTSKLFAQPQPGPRVSNTLKDIWFRPKTGFAVGSRPDRRWVVHEETTLRAERLKAYALAKTAVKDPVRVQFERVPPGRLHSFGAGL